MYCHGQSGIVKVGPVTDSKRSDSESGDADSNHNASPDIDPLAHNNCAVGRHGYKGAEQTQLINEYGQQVRRTLGRARSRRLRFPPQ